MDFDRLVALSLNLEKQKKTRYNHYAFILRHNTILTIGMNRKRSHPKCNQTPYNTTGWNDLHAEMDAAIRLGRTNCKSLTIVVMRIRSNGKLGLSKPCPGCMHLIEQLGFKKVYYSAEQNFMELRKVGKKWLSLTAY